MKRKERNMLVTCAIGGLYFIAWFLYSIVKGYIVIP